MRSRDERKEEAIRRAALQMIVRVGLDGFSMQKLARAARVSPATLYIYFADRDDLVFQVYRREMERMMTDTLEDFDPAQPFAEGLRVQWRNRARYCLANPLQAQFLEQVRHSPYQEKFFPRLDHVFYQQMSLFAQNALRRKEMRPMPKEVFWAVVYAPLYQLIKFHQSGHSMFGGPKAAGEPKFKLTDQVLEQALQLVIRAVKP
jgi:TetR/AcrR family transcriptional regulator, multidrug resistance operon repressor